MVDIDTIREEWRQRGYSCELHTLAPGERREDLLHDADALLLPVVGDLELQMAGLTRAPEEGEEVELPAETLHTVTNVGRIPAIWLDGRRLRD